MSICLPLMVINKKSIENCQKKKNFKYFKFYTYLIAETKPYKPQRNQKLALGIQTYQILTNDVEVCIPRLSSILLAILGLLHNTYTFTARSYYNYQCCHKSPLLRR